MRRVSLCAPRAVQEIQSGMHRYFLLVHVDSTWLDRMGWESVSLGLCNLSIAASNHFKHEKYFFFPPIFWKMIRASKMEPCFLLLQTEKKISNQNGIPEFLLLFLPTHQYQSETSSFSFIFFCFSLLFGD